MASLQLPIMAVEVEVTATEQQQPFLIALHYIAPALILVYFSVAVTVSVCTLQNLRARRAGPRKVLVCLVSLIVISFLVESCLLLADTAFYGAHHSSTDGNVYALASLLTWAILALSITNTENPVVWYPYYGSWLIGMVAEAIFFIFGIARALSPGAFVYAQTAIQACRMVVLVLLSTVLFTKCSKSTKADEESACLLRHDERDPSDTHTSSGKPDYGSVIVSAEIEDADTESDDEDLKKLAEKKEQRYKRLQAEGNWFTYAKSFSVFIPYLWPPRSREFQTRILGVCLCLLCARALNVLEPRQFGIVIDRLSMSRGQVPLQEFGLWALFGWFRYSVLREIRAWIWLPVEQYAEGSIKTASYNRIMDLSRDFHTAKKSAQLYTAISQGISLKTIAEVLFFKVLPLLVDVGVAFVYLYWVFGPYMALIVAATTVVFVWASFAFVGQQTEPRRKWNGLVRKEYRVMYDTIGEWSSVSYFSRHGHEKGRYAKAVDLSIKAGQKWYYLFYTSLAAKDTIIELGMICACTLAIYQICKGAPVGGFVMLVSYWSNFTGKLQRIVETQRQLIQSLLDAESLLELFMKKPSVKDGQEIFEFKRGTIHFHDVGFSYDGQKDVIKDFNFHAAPGQKVALVGETGGGKSTILRLLFRFYDVNKGSITIDDQNIRNFTLSSLRQHIGVVPQDPSLFNISIMENVRYARLDATNEEVMEACKAASIHEKILRFPKGYSTKVGEKGAQLSGGEMQRVAIARVILQNAKIILFDEATSSVDTETEENIQDALRVLTSGRTTFTVAHRLSTVTSSDTILVIKDGVIVEQGSPRELIESKGKFYGLWRKQIDDVLTTSPQPKFDTNSKTSPGEETRRSSGSSTSGNKSLRATAPDFVPLSQRGTSISKGQASHAHENEVQQNSHDSRNVKKGGVKNKRSQKNKGLAVGSEPTTGAVLSDSRPTTSESQNSSQSQSETKKRAKSNLRRGKNKSEPASSQNAGLTDEPSQDQPRHLSAVGTDAANQASSGHGHRHQLNQRRKKAAQSETLSGGASGAWSSDTLHPSTKETSLDSANAADPTIGSRSTAKDADSAPGV